MTRRKRKVSGRIERRRALRANAMPEVKRLVGRYGIATIGGCLSQLREVAKTAMRIKALQKEARGLRRKIGKG